MFGCNGDKSRSIRSTGVGTPKASATPSTLLAIVGQQSRVEGTFLRQGAQK